MALFACKVGGSEGAVHTGLMIDAGEQKYGVNKITTGTSNSNRNIFAILDGKYTRLISSTGSTATPYRTLNDNFQTINSGNFSANAPANLTGAMYVLIQAQNTALNNVQYSIS